MEILANNGYEEADRVGDAGLSDACEVENGLMAASSSALAGNRNGDYSSLHLEDESAIVNLKKRAFDEGLKELRSPAKKLAIRGPSDVELDSTLSDSSLGDAMLIDTAWGESVGRFKVSDAQAVPGSPKIISGSITACTSVYSLSVETGIGVDGAASRVGEAAEGNSNSQNVDVVLGPADSRVAEIKCDGELTTSNSAELAVRGSDSMNGIHDSHLPTVVEDDVVKEECTMISQNGHVDMGIEEHVISYEAAEEGRHDLFDAEVSVPYTAGDGGVVRSSRSGDGSGKTKDGGHYVGCSSAFADDVYESEERTTPVLVGSQIAQTCNGLGKSVVADVADQREIADEEGANDDSGTSEVGGLQMEKADALKSLEMKMVEVIMESLTYEVAGSRNDETSNPLSGDGLETSEEHGNESKDFTNGTIEEDKCTELFEPVVRLPEFSGGTNGFIEGAVGSENLISDMARENSLLNQELRGSAVAAVASSKDLEFPQYSGSEKGGDSMDRQDSDVATPSAATSAQSRSPRLKSRLKLKGQGEVGMRQSPTFNCARGFVVKEILLKEAPASAKLLLQSGLLDGHHVRYMGRGGHIMLTGIIQEGGVLCDCSSCKGVQVVNVSAFEKHAGSSARHPSDFIFLENGKCLKDILEIGWNANKQKMNVMDVLKSAIGEVGGEKVQISSLEHPLIATQPALKKFPQLRPSLDTKPRVPVDVKPRTFQGDTKLRMPSDIKARSTPEVKARGSDPRASMPRLDRTPREKETASPPVLSRESSGANLHKALFLPGGLEDETEVGYYVKGQKYLAGVKKGSGILCSCCQQVISCSLFEQHAGWGSRRNPYTSIYLADGRSLHDAAQSLVVEQNVKQEGTTPAKIDHLDQCVECGDSGDLQLCTGCPNAYHQDCLGSADPSLFGEFFCPDCQEQRFGGTKDRRRSMAKRRSKGAAKTLLSKERVTGRCSRLLQVPEAVVLGGCVFCKSGDFAKTGFGPKTTLLCDQCEREYHVGCLKKHGLEDLKELPEGEWFCGQDCKHIHSILSLLVSNGPEPLADSIISKVLKTNQTRLEGSEDATESSCSGFEWQLLHGRGGDPSNGKALAEAVQIFSECFDPIADGVSGGDLIPLMVYRRSLRDQDFGGIYCVVLKYDNRVVSTALIRVFGRQLAELPLLATNPSNQGQGHCKALLLSIERLLGVLRVERLALPAAEGAEGIWLNKFGFRRMAEGQVKQCHSDLNMMVFTGSFMLEKEIPPLEITGSRKT